MPVGRAIRAGVVVAQHPVAVIGDAMDAPAVDFDMGENAMVLGLQGGFHGVGLEVLHVFSRSDLSRSAKSNQVHGRD